MGKFQVMTIDGNTAAAHAAYAFSEVAAIYPITPSSPMGETSEEWSAKGRVNVFGQTLDVVEMQSEAGAAGAVHGVLSGGAMATTFTASQGLLLMIPNMYKIAGEMLPTVFHVSARSLAAQSLSIFGDHSDVMSVRNTGFAMTAAASIQETHDLGVISHLATLEAKVPFLSFFDGFRTSHELQKIEVADYAVLKEMLDMKFVEDFRSRALSPDRPVAKVGAQNPDVYFQGRETVNKYYMAVPSIVKKYMALFAEKFGREYKLFDYVGAKDAEKIIILMGSGCETAEETVNYLVGKGEKVGAIKVRLYRPFSVEDFLSVMPETVKKIAVLDRTKEPGSIGDPLYLDVVAALKGKNIEVIGGRYGLSSKEFTPPMVKAVYEHLDSSASHGFTVGIEDDVTNTSIKVDNNISTEPEGVHRCKFWGLGSDGTVGANKNSIKIIGDNTDLNAQAYFVYDSKKSGGVTISHLRFGKEKIQSEYLLTTCDFVALHNPSYIGRYDILEGIKDGGTFLINSSWKPEEVFDNLTKDMQETIINKKIKVYTIDATHIAMEVGLGNRISSIMQTAFFAVYEIVPKDKAIESIKKAIEKTFMKKGESIVNMNKNAVDKTLENLAEVTIPASISKSAEPVKLLGNDNSTFARSIIEPVIRLKGDDIPVSAMSYDGVIPTGTTRLEKRGVAVEVPQWLSENCIQCNQCSFVCPHAAIRVKQIEPKDLSSAPEGFNTIKANGKHDVEDLQYIVQVYPEDCQGCGSCVEACLGRKDKETGNNLKALKMVPIEVARANGETEKAEFFDSLPENMSNANISTVRGSQFKTPLFEFSGACAGCGETPYVKLVTQLFGDRMIIANATGCSSIYGGTFPTIPYTKTPQGKGPAWANSLFEDNAEYGFGMRLSVDANRKQLRSNVEAYTAKASGEIVSLMKKALENWNSKDNEAQETSSKIASLLPKAIESASGEEKAILKKIEELKDYFVDKSVWIFGGDGWAYDIGYGGLDHVMASDKNINVLVMDTEVYSNTGGQASKATPRGAIAKFAASGKKTGKKNLGLMMMSYGSCYVASANIGSDKNQLVKALMEAEAYDGPSIVIVYAACIAHGIKGGMTVSVAEEAKASAAGHWPLYRFNPTGEFSWDSKEATEDFDDYIMGETRYNALTNLYPDEAKRLFPLAKEDAKKRFEALKAMKKD